MLKRCGLLVVLLLLVLMTAGCMSGSATYYTYQNGIKKSCTGSAPPPFFIPSSGDCGDSFYGVQPDGTVYHCTGTTLPTCDTSHSVTPPWACSPKYMYDNLMDKGQSWKVVDHEVNQNNSSTPAQVTFSSNTATTVTVTDELGVTTSAKGSIGIIEASVQTQINLSVSVSVAVTVGNQDTFTIPPGETAYANYGVKVQITSGHFYNKAPCSGEKSDWGADITYVPIATGWCVWTSDQPPCPSI